MWESLGIGLGPLISLQGPGQELASFSLCCLLVAMDNWEGATLGTHQTKPQFQALTFVAQWLQAGWEGLAVRLAKGLKQRNKA